MLSNKTVHHISYEIPTKLTAHIHFHNLEQGKNKNYRNLRLTLECTSDLSCQHNAVYNSTQYKSINWFETFRP